MMTAVKCAHKTVHVRPSSMEVGMDQLVISVAEACGVTRLGRTKLNELIRNGTLDSVKVGQRRLIKVASINRLLEAA